MGYLIVAAYLGFGIFFNYTPGDWVVGAIIWGVVYFSGATDTLSSDNTKIDDEVPTPRSKPEVISVSPKATKKNPYKIDSVESANKFEKHFFNETLKTLPKISSEEYRQVNETIADLLLVEKYKCVNSSDTTIFKTFEEAKEYLEKDPNGKSIVRLDDNSGFKVNGFNKNPAEQKASVTSSKTKTTITSDYFKIESYPTVRVVNAQWLGGVQEIQNIRNENIKNNRKINSGMPISLEEVDLFISWVESGRSLLEIESFFQRKMSSLEKFVSKDGVKRGELADRCRVTSWSESNKPKLSKKTTALLNKKDELLGEVYIDTIPLNGHVINSPVECKGLDELIQNPCLDCDCEIPQVRLDRIPGAIRCASCQSKFEKDNPDSVARKFQDKGIMTREGAKQMRAKQYGTNIRNKI